MLLKITFSSYKKCTFTNADNAINPIKSNLKYGLDNYSLQLLRLRESNFYFYSKLNKIKSTGVDRLATRPVRTLILSFEQA